MTKVSICICTYRRPNMLADLLDSLQISIAAANAEVRVIVVDNDPKGSARHAAETYRDALPLTYAHEPVANISTARNRCLSLATGDYVAFVDDDEKVSASWLRDLLQTATEHEADVVLGPVIAQYPDTAARWFKQLDPSSRRGPQTDALVDWKEGRTGNALIKRSSLRELTFDESLGRSGGEDSDLFRRLYATRKRFLWSNNAIVTEYQPPDRCTLTYLLSRRFKSGVIHDRINGHESTSRKLMRFAYRVTRGFAKCVAGVPFAMMGQPRLAIEGLLSLSLAAGGMKGILQRNALSRLKTYGNQPDSQCATVSN
ncbi:MAG: glycosyltransferase family 2 protein [Phycisphaerae bacterium]